MGIHAVCVRRRARGLAVRHCRDRPGIRLRLTAGAREERPCSSRNRAESPPKRRGSQGRLAAYSADDSIVRISCWESFVNHVPGFRPAPGRAPPRPTRFGVTASAPGTRVPVIAGVRSPFPRPRGRGTARRFASLVLGTSLLSSTLLACAASETDWRSSLHSSGAFLSTRQGPPLTIGCTGYPSQLTVGVTTFAREPGLESIVVRARDKALVLPLPVAFAGPVVGRTAMGPQALDVFREGSPLVVQYGKRALVAPALSRRDLRILETACLG